MRSISSVLFIIFIYPLAWSQETITDNSIYQAVYNFNFQRDSTDVNTKGDEKMILFIGDRYSLFESYYNRYNDSIGKALDKKYPDKSDVQSMLDEFMVNMKKVRFNFRILKNKKQTLVLNFFFSDHFNYEEKESME